MAVRTIAVLLAVAIFASAGPASAQKYQFVGRGKCVNCHDHDNEKLWSEKKDGPPPNNHLTALKQMENVKTKDFTKAVGVTDPYDPGSTCVRCHATVVKGDVSGGVTCETCHGAGAGYLDPHQKKDSYPQAVMLGMNDVVKKPSAWAPVCMRCHVMDDVRLIEAKHPSGDDFDLGAKYPVVMTGHWKSNYGNKAEISALGKAEKAKLVAARKGAPVVTAAVPVPPPAPAEAAAASSPPAAAPATLPVTTAGSAAVPGDRTPPATSSTPAGAPASPKPMPPAAAPPNAAPPAAAPRGPQRPPASAPITVARGPDSVMTGLPDVSADSTTAMSTAVMSSVALLLPQSPAAAVAAIQGRAIVLLDSLLRRGGRAPLRVVPSERKTEYRGPDSDLIRLQDDVLALALEALRTAPPPANAIPASK